MFRLFPVLEVLTCVRWLLFDPYDWSCMAYCSYDTRVPGQFGLPGGFLVHSASAALMRDVPTRLEVRSWACRQRLVVRTLQKYRPLVVCTQEAFGTQLEDLCRALPQYQCFGESRFPDRDQEHCAVLVDKRLAVHGHETLWLSETPEVRGSKSWDSSLPRIATIATLDFGPKGRKRLYEVSYYNVLRC